VILPTGVLQMMNKYFANDGDKFVFWVEEGFIDFEKISTILEAQFKHGTTEFKQAYKELKSLPTLDWRSFTYKERK